MYRPVLNRFYRMTTKVERKLELYRLPLAALLEEYAKVKGACAIDDPQLLTAVIVSQLIQSIVDAEFPKE